MKSTSVTNRAKNALALIDAEIILVNRVDTDAKTLEIQRGYGGTQAGEHAKRLPGLDRHGGLLPSTDVIGLCG